jgi:hypothetical protein
MSVSWIGLGVAALLAFWGLTQSVQKPVTERKPMLFSKYEG